MLLYISTSNWCKFLHIHCIINISSQKKTSNRGFICTIVNCLWVYIMEKDVCNFLDCQNQNLRGGSFTICKDIGLLRTLRVKTKIAAKMSQFFAIPTKYLWNDSSRSHIEKYIKQEKREKERKNGISKWKSTKAEYDSTSSTTEETDTILRFQTRF